MTAPLFGNLGLITYFHSLMVSTAIIILAGIPAALYERHVGAKDDSTDASMWIWLAGTAILAIPAVGTFLRGRAMNPRAGHAIVNTATPDRLQL